MTYTFWFTGIKKIVNLINFLSLPIIRCIMNRIYEYKGYKILELSEGRNVISFGKAKAKLIIENIDVIKEYLSHE